MNQNDNKTLITGGIVIAAALAVLLALMFSPDGANQPQSINENNAPAVVKTAEQAAAPPPIEEKPNKKAPPFIKYKHKHTYIFTISGNIEGFRFEVPLPETEEHKQYVSELKIEPEPSEIIKSDGNKTAVFKIPSMHTGEFQISIEGISKVRTYNIKTAKKLNLDISDKKDLQRYISPEKKIESNDAYIKKLAAKLKGKGTEETAANIYRFLQNNMSYSITNENFGAKKALELRYGKCTEYAAAMTALLRALNIPSRVVTGDIARTSNTPHNWVEIYYDGYGWVTYDPSIRPELIKIYGADGKYLKTEKRYNTSHNELQYIKSAANIFEPYKFQYLTREGKFGSVSIKRQIDIKRI